jgi:soluble lytic murein transglycosylase-like protein
MEIRNMAGGFENEMGSSGSSLVQGSAPVGQTPAANTSGAGMMDYWLTQLLGKADRSPQTNTNSAVTSLPGFPENTAVGQSAGTESQTFANAIEAASRAFGLPASLIHSVIQTESGYDTQAVSSAGAVGLMQLMPDTAREMGVNNPLDPVQNIWGGTRYLASLMNQFHGNVELAVAAYNAGPGAVLNYSGVPPYPETTAYVKKVMTGAGLTEV